MSTNTDWQKISTSTALLKCILKKFRISLTEKSSDFSISSCETKFQNSLANPDKKDVVRKFEAHRQPADILAT